MPELRKHQIHTKQHVLDHPHACVFNEPGTGKTASVLAAIREAVQAKEVRRTLVLCPKTIMEPAWLDDCRTFTPELKLSVAYAGRRRRAFDVKSDIVVVNSDGVKWVAENQHLLDEFDMLVIDESTAYKNRNSQRSRAANAIADRFNRRVIMTGTPMPNGLEDIWHQVLLVDRGERLGTRFYAFRAATHDPVQTPYGITEWREKEGAREAVADLLSDITVLYKFEECTDIPPNEVSYRTWRMPAKLAKAYREMAANALLELEEGTVSAVHAAALTNKLLQVASGAVYDADGNYHLIDDSRYELVAELVAEREHSLIAFSWKHQRDGIIRALEAKGIDTYAVIDGNARDVQDIVRRFQAGEYRALLAHPASASHGLTLTRATTTIWASPIWDSERFEQFNRRIYRTGQTRRTETILIQAEDTVDVRCYAKLQGKIDDQSDLMFLLKALSSTKEAA